MALNGKFHSSSADNEWQKLCAVNVRNLQTTVISYPLDCGFTARLKLIIVDKQVGKIAASIKCLLWVLQSLCYEHSHIRFNYEEK